MIATYDALLDSIKDADEPQILEWVASAKSLNQANVSGVDGIAAYDILIYRFKDAESPEILKWVARAMYYKGYALAGAAEKTSAYDALFCGFAAIAM